MMRALKAELRKLKRARMLLWGALTVVVYTLSIVGMATTIMKPDMVERIGASGGAFTEAAAKGLYSATWENYLRWTPQGISGAWGLLLFGVLTAYLFGREYSEGTAKNMLTLPVRREWFVLAKMAVLAAWVLALTVLSTTLSVAAGTILDIDGFAWAHVWRCLSDSLTVSLLIYTTLPLVALLAVRGKGYLPPMLFTAIMMAIGMVVITTDAARWFPWSMPSVHVGATWLPIPPSDLVAGSWALAGGVFVAGLAILVIQVNAADNAQ